MRALYEFYWIFAIYLLLRSSLFALSTDCSDMSIAMFLRLDCDVVVIFGENSVRKVILELCSELKVM